MTDVKMTDRQREVFAERVALEAVVGQNSPQVRVTLEEDCRADAESDQRPDRTLSGLFRIRRA